MADVQYKTFVMRLVPAASSIHSRHFFSAEPSTVNCRAFFAELYFRVTRSRLRSAPFALFTALSHS